MTPRKTRKQELEENVDNLIRTVYVDLLNTALDKAELDVAEMYGGQLCSMRDIHGDDTCPICYFRIRFKEHLYPKG